MKTKRVLFIISTLIFSFLIFETSCNKEEEKPSDDNSNLGTIIASKANIKQFEFATLISSNICYSPISDH